MPGPEQSKRAQFKEDPDVMADTGGRNRVHFEEGTPEEYMLFEAAAKAVLLDYDGDREQEKQLKRMLGNHALGVCYAGRTSNYGNTASVFTELRGAFGGKTTDRALSELERLKQGSGDISEHISKFNQLASQAGVVGHDKARRFTDSVNETLRLQLLNSGLTVFVDLAERARLLAPITERQYNRMKGKSSEDKGGKKYGKNRVNKATEASGSGGKAFTGECYNCGKTGHRKSECRSATKEKGLKALEAPPVGRVQEIDSEPEN